MLPVYIPQGIMGTVVTKLIEFLFTNQKYNINKESQNAILFFSCLLYNKYWLYNSSSSETDLLSQTKLIMDEDQVSGDLLKSLSTLTGLFLSLMSAGLWPWSLFFWGFTWMSHQPLWFSGSLSGFFFCRLSPVLWWFGLSDQSVSLIDK